MDKKPFLTVNLLSLKDSEIPYLQKFEKSNFTVGDATAKANELRYSEQIQQILAGQIDNPSDNFVNYVIADIHKGRKTQRVIDDFRPLVKRAFIQLINNRVSDKIKTTLDSEMVASESKSVMVEPPVNPPMQTPPDTEKLESFFVVKALVHECLNGKTITCKDTESISEIFIDDAPEKWICKIDYSEKKLYINIQSGDKEFLKRQIRSAEDIYFYRAQLCRAVQNFNA